MSRIINGQPPSLTTRSAPGSASRRQVVTHFETWAASQISKVIDESHRIWQSAGSGAQLARFVTPPVRAAALPDCPFANRSSSTDPGCFCSQITANAVVAKSEIRGLLLRLWSLSANPGKAPGRSFQKRTLLPVPPVLSGPDQARLSPTG
jgi:hypothetical protein